MDQTADTAHHLLCDAAQRLLDRAAEGDTDAFGSFYDLTSPMVFRLARLLASDEHAAECLTILTYEQAWHEASSFDPASSTCLVWLLGIAQAVSRDLAPAA